MRAKERGFTLLETVVAALITSVAILGVAASVSRTVRAVSAGETRIELADDALNVLTDLRAIAAYDGGILRVLAAHSPVSSEVRLPDDRDGRVLAITTSVAAAEGGAYRATVTVADAAGRRLTEEAILLPEAPAPGSRIEADRSHAAR